MDEVDRSTNHIQHPKIYPDLSPLASQYSSTGSPTAWHPEDRDSHDESFCSVRSQCYPRPGWKTPGKTPPRDQPMTPEKGHHGRSLLGESPQREQRNTKRGASTLFYIFISFALIVAIFQLKQCFEEVQDSPDKKPYMKPIAEVYEEIKGKFKDIISLFRQHKSVWIQLIGQIESIMTDFPSQPAVVLVVVPEDSKLSASCLMSTITQAIVDAFGGKLCDHITTLLHLFFILLFLYFLFW